MSQYTPTSHVEPSVLISDLDINYEEDSEYLLDLEEEIIWEVYAEVYTEEADAELDFLMDEDFDYEDLN